jgi:hypothetical protein
VEEVVGLDCEEIYWTKREEMVKRKMSEVGAAGQTFVEL